MPNQFLLTFDVEDFINVESLRALSSILNLLEKYGLKAVFFITGHMAEKLALHPEITRSLMVHEIGFHSSAHSVHPTIFEYCDVERYEDAYYASVKRETSHVDPLSGKVEEEGGILALGKLFPNKNIRAYRAPGCCCPPPNLEAMAGLGIRYDFSWSVSNGLVNYKGITFYPKPIFRDCDNALLGSDLQIINWSRLIWSILTREMTVLDFHPQSLVERGFWDSAYHMGNPLQLKRALLRDSKEMQSKLAKLEVLLKRVHNLEKVGLIVTSPNLMKSKTCLDTTKLDIDELADDFSYWPKKFFGYEPKYLRSQLLEFFELD
jgi:hypothetical protein